MANIIDSIMDVVVGNLITLPIGLVFALTDEAKEIPFLDKISIVK